jgi:hypothetical protein
MKRKPRPSALQQRQRQRLVGGGPKTSPVEHITLFLVKSIPIVIEPGVAALEADLTVADKAVGARTVSAVFQRLQLDEKVATELPLVPTTERPHIFSLHDELAKSPLLLVYDLLGRLTTIYVREVGGKSTWERRDVADEHAGRTVAQFSVRFCFSALADRNKFVSLMDDMSQQVRSGESITKKVMNEAVTLLSRSRVAPVVLPVAVAKSS